MSLGALIQSHPRTTQVGLLLLLLGMCTVNYLLFPAWAGTTYLGFYAKAGAAVAIGTLLLEMAWKDIEKNTAITSRDSLVDLSGSLQLRGLPLFALGVHLDRKYRSHRALVLDLLFCMPFIFIMLSGLAGWLLLIAPLQYFLNYICRAPSLIINQSNATVLVRLRDGWKLETPIRTKSHSVPSDPPDMRWDASLRGKEQKLTNAYSAILIIGLDWLLPAASGIQSLASFSPPSNMLTRQRPPSPIST